MNGIAIMPIVYTILLALIAWWVTERFSPDPLLTKIIQAVIFVIVLGLVVTKLLGMH